MVSCVSFNFYLNLSTKTKLKIITGNILYLMMYDGVPTQMAHHADAIC